MLGAMTAEEKPHFRAFARNLCAALTAHRMRIGFRTAIEKYITEEVDQGWYDLAAALEKASAANVDAIDRRVSGSPVPNPPRSVQ